MKNWKLTTALAATAITTVALAFLYGQQDGEPPQNNEANQQEIKWDFLPEVVATYGDKKISREELVNLIKEISASFPGGANSGNLNPEIVKAVAPQVVRGMIDKSILLDMAAEDGIKPSPELVIKAFDESIKKVPAEKMPEVEENLAKQGKTIDSYREELSKIKIAQEDSAIGYWIRTKLAADINIKDDEVKKYYDENIEAFTSPESVNASHILIKSKSESEEDMNAAKKRCNELKSEIESGKTTFEKAAEEFSDCPSGKKAKGNLGEFTKGNMIKEFEDVAFSMKKDSISDPVKTIYGYHIIKLLNHKDKTIAEFTEVNQKISEYLKEQQLSTKVKELLEKKRTELNVKINLPEAQMPMMQMPNE